MPRAAHPGNGNHDEEEIPVWPFSSFLLFLAWLGLMASVTVSLGFFLVVGDVPIGLVVANMILLVVLVLGTLLPSNAGEPLRCCDVCRHAQEPTRCPSRGRLWTCFSCGRETPRIRTPAEPAGHP